MAIRLKGTIAKYGRPNSNIPLFFQIRLNSNMNVRPKSTHPIRFPGKLHLVPIQGVEFARIKGGEIVRQI